MLKRLKTHHLYRRSRLAAKHWTTAVKPGKRGGGGRSATGTGGEDNRRKQISGFINLRTHKDVLICNITASSRSSPALCRVTQHHRSDFKTRKEKQTRSFFFIKKKRKSTRLPFKIHQKSSAHIFRGLTGKFQVESSKPPTSVPRVLHLLLASSPPPLSKLLVHRSV